MTVPGRSRARQHAVSRAGNRRPRSFTRLLDVDGSPLRTSEYFGTATFGFELIDKLLAPADVQTLRGAATSKEPLSRDLADKVARAVRDWAMESMTYRDKVYDVPENGRLGYQYSYNYFDIVELRVAQAGVRLAGLINEIYN